MNRAFILTGHLALDADHLDGAFAHGDGLIGRNLFASCILVDNGSDNILRDGSFRIGYNSETESRFSDIRAFAVT